jgi:hypothetical protein
MKTKIRLIFVFLLLHFGIQAQTVLSGMVTDSLNVPIPNVAVYLSKTTVGVLTNRNGVYSLSIPQDGTYELIASCVGYKSHSQIINTTGGDKKINIKLSERKVLIKEVTIKGKDRNRRQNYALFLKCFIGITLNAPFCTIDNPKDLIVYRESNDSNLIAYSVNPLIITNSSFGYKIIYDLKDFKYNLKTENLTFTGYYYFQDISNQKRENSRTKRSRLAAYYGSRMHFLRALFTDSLSEENFIIYDTKIDSKGQWVTSDIIHENDIRLAFTPDSMILYRSNPIDINYTYNYLPEPRAPVFRTGEYISRIIFSDSLQVYRNGYYPNGINLSWGGDITWDRVAELLPYDYVPKPIIKQEVPFP